MNLYSDDADGVCHSIIMYDGVIVITECGTSFAVTELPQTRPHKRACGRCFPHLN